MKANEITLYEHEEFGKVRAYIDENGEVWVCCSDVCHILKYDYPKDAVKRLVSKEDIVKIYTPTKMGLHPLNYINERGFHSLASGSKSHNATSLKRWIMTEVMTTSGGGARPTAEAFEEFISNPDNFLKVAERWKRDMNDVRESAEAKVRQLEQEKVALEQENARLEQLLKERNAELMVMETDRVRTENFVYGVDYFTSDQIALMHDMDAHQLHEALVELGVLQKDDHGGYVLSPKYQNKGYLGTVWARKSGSSVAVCCTKWTPSGYKFIHDLLMHRGNAPMEEREEG